MKNWWGSKDEVVKHLPTTSPITHHPSQQRSRFYGCKLYSVYSSRERENFENICKKIFGRDTVAIKNTDKKAKKAVFYALYVVDITT